MWTSHAECKTFISDCWNENVVGCPMFILNTKLKNLKHKLKIWNKQVFGNIHDYVNEAEKNLDNIHNQIQSSGHADDLHNLEKLAHLKLDDALNKQNIFWHEKAQLSWHVDGDRNTKYFQSFQNQEQNKNYLFSQD